MDEAVKLVMFKARPNADAKWSEFVGEFSGDFQMFEDPARIVREQVGWAIFEAGDFFMMDTRTREWAQIARWG